LRIISDLGAVNAFGILVSSEEGIEFGYTDVDGTEFVPEFLNFSSAGSSPEVAPV
jgi:hypothetical protein